MTEQLTLDQVRQIAHLARLELTETELTALTPQLAAVVGFVARLQELDTSAIEPLAHALPVSNVFREDAPLPSLPLEEALAAAPEPRAEERGRFFGVPAVLE